MTLAEIKNQIMFQTNNDEEDIDDYLPHVVDYINDGYDRLVKVWTKSHAPQDEYPLLEKDTDVPNLPNWVHRYIADWATWLVYRNGNPQKQNRGLAFRYAFEEVLAKLSDEGGLSGLNEDGTNIQYKKFRNIPV
jgi:phosphatidylethanolamine-binding protein (PEBP) family uncharacterized protein